MDRKQFLPLICAALLMSGIFTLAFTERPVRLFVNDAEITPEVTPYLHDGRTIAPVRPIAEALGADVSWNEKTWSVNVVSAGWLSRLINSLDEAAGKLPTTTESSGEIQTVWRVDDQHVLLEHVTGWDYEFHLCNHATGHIECIVSLFDNARLKSIEENEILFVGKGGDDTGNYSFPYLLRYDLEGVGLWREEKYLARDVVFGKMGAWSHEFESVDSKDEMLLVDLQVSGDQMLAGGHSTPFTVVSVNGDVVSLYMYDVTAVGAGSAELDHPLVTKVKWETEAPDVLIDYEPLIAEDFPYGGRLTDFEPEKPVTVIDIYTDKPCAFSIETTPADNLSFRYHIHLEGK